MIVDGFGCDIWCLLLSWPMPSLYISVVVFIGLYIHLNNKINNRDRLRGYTKKQEREWKKQGIFEQELRRLSENDRFLL